MLWANIYHMFYFICMSITFLFIFCICEITYIFFILSGYFIYPHFDLRPICILKLFNSIWIISPGFVMAENASGSKTVFTNRRTHLDIMVYVYIHAFSYKTIKQTFRHFQIVYYLVQNFHCKLLAPFQAFAKFWLNFLTVLSVVSVFF